MEIKDIKQINRGPIKLSFSLYFPKMGMTLRDFKLMESNTKLWICSPSREYQDNDGKKKYYSYVFIDKDRQDKFNQVLIEMVRPNLQVQPPASSSYVDDSLPF